MGDLESLIGVVPEFEQHDRMRLAMRHGTVSSTDMADTLGVSAGTLRNYLSGRTKPSRAVVKVWAWRCQVDEEWLLSGRAETTPATSITARINSVR